MERKPIETAVSGKADAPPVQCPHCASRTLFWWRNPKGRSFTWFCSTCRRVHTHALSDSTATAAPPPADQPRSIEEPAQSVRPSSLSRPATRPSSRTLDLPQSLK